VTYGLLDLMFAVDEVAVEGSEGYFAAQNFAAADSLASGARNFWRGVWHGSVVVVVVVVVIGVPDVTATRPRKRME
jgi:hypothetical protein